MRVNRKEFHTALVACARVIDAKSPMPILRSVLLSFSEDALFVYGTDLTGFLRCDVDADRDVDRPDIQCAVPLKTLAALVQPIGRAEALDFVELAGGREGDRPKLTVTIGQDSTTIWCLNVEDFPEMEVFESTDTESKISYQAGQFSEAIDYVSQACETSEYRHLNVINIDGQFITATDGHRIHREIIVPASNELFPSVLIPENAVPVLTEICGRLEAEDEIELQYFSFPRETSQEPVWFVRVDLQEANREFIVQLVDAKAPNYAQVIPGEDELGTRHAIFLEANTLERVLSRMKKVVSGLCQPTLTLTLNAYSAKLKLVSKDDDTDIEMVLDARAIQFRSQAKRIVREINGVSIDCEEIPTEVSVGFDVAYMMDAIDGAKGEIVLAFSDNISPIRVDVSPNRLAIVMPVRT